MSVNPTIEKLLRRTYGGDDAAVVPGLGDITALPEATPPAGVEEVMSFLRSRLEGGTGAEAEWVFLVGGPGNGKSFQLVKLLAALGETAAGDVGNGLAPRGFDVGPGDHILRVINDASIPRDDVDLEAGIGSLAGDLRRSLESDRPPHLLVNINRGILVEELARVRREPESFKQVKAIMEWLNAEAAQPIGDVNKDGLQTVDVGKGSDYFRLAVLESGSVRMRVYGLFLDRLSLFEQLPGRGGPAIRGLGTDSVEASAYTLLELNDARRTESPAGRLVSEVVNAARFEENECASCPALSSCPFVANARSLRSEAGLQGFLKLARGAEIAGGRLFTYRDLWALLCSSIVGRRRPEWLRGTQQGQHPCDWVQTNVVHLDGARDRAARVEAGVLLSQQRLHNALFMAKTPRFLAEDQAGADAPTPAARSLLEVDPALDVSPAWAEDVNRAMEGTAFRVTPGATVRDRNANFASVWQELDSKLDALELAWMSKDGQHWSEAERREVLSWQAKALYRLFALSNGVFAHQRAVTEWTKLRRKAGKGGSEVSITHLGPALKNLLLPGSTFSEGSAWALLPVFHARTEPVKGVRDDHTWCCVVETNQVYPHIDALGDSLWLVLRNSRTQRQVARVHVDLAICREALASATGFGFTERGADAAPKLERARASFIADGREPGLVVLVQGALKPAEFDEEAAPWPG